MSNQSYFCIQEQIENNIIREEAMCAVADNVWQMSWWLTQKMVN